MSIGDEVKKLRQEHGKKVKILGQRKKAVVALTQVEMAKRLGVSQGWISKIEKGKLPNPPLSFLFALRKEFHFNINRFLDEAIGSNETFTGPDDSTSDCDKS